MTLIFCIHYFLWYGALTSIFGYESVYARYYTNATPMQYGYLNLVLPFMTVLVTPVICSSADRQRSHRSYFTISLVLTTISICLYAMMPLLDNPKQGDDHHPPGNLLWGPWVYYCLTSLVCDLSMGINTCLSDSFAVLQAEESGTSFGKIIVWGTLGWASTALVLSVINQWSALPRLVPGLIFGAILLTIDVVIVSWWPKSASFRLDIIPSSVAQTVTGGASAADKDSRAHATSFRMQLQLLGLIMMRRKSLIRYLILFILSGFFMSMQWNYFFLYLEMIYYDKFELISALSMVGQSLLGELPFFILSRKVIDHCGRSHTLSISVISIGIRFLLYAYLLPNVSIYCIVLADCFQGPNYGLFYVVMTEVGLEFSFCDDETIERLVARGELDRNNRVQVDSLKLSLRSTVQSVAFACYEGIGVGLGSLAGGWLVASFGFKTLWLSMAAGSITVGLINLLIEFACPETDGHLNCGTGGRLTGDQGEFMYPSRVGHLLKEVAAPPPLADSQSQQAGPIAQSPQELPKTTANKRPMVVMVRKSAGSRVAP